jgi:hypothetical protein
MIVEEGPSGGVAVSFAATALDAVDGAVVPDCSPASGSVFARDHTTTVTCTATDAQSNSGAAFFDVTVGDTTEPVVTVPADMTVPAMSSSGAPVSYVATAEDSVDGALTPDCSPASGSVFAREATTTVTCTATDAHDNASSATFTVGVHGVVTTADANPEDMRVEVSTNAGFAAGDYVVIDEGQPDEEVRLLAGIGSLVFAAPLASAHPTGTLVSLIEPPEGDTVAPAIAFASPASGQRVTKGASLSGAFSCTDAGAGNDAGVGVEACRGDTATGARLDTSSLGVHTLSVRAWDWNGNASTASISYTVVAAAATAGALPATGLVPNLLVPATALLLALVGGGLLLYTRRRRA